MLLATRCCSNQLAVFLIILVCATASGQLLKEPLHLHEVLTYEFSTKGWNGTWISDTEIFYKSNANLLKFNAATKKLEYLYNTASGNYSGASYSLSPDNKYILISYNPKAVFRHSKTAQYAIYDIQNTKYYDIADKKQLQLVKWSPHEGLVYVLDNNIYYLSSADKVANPTKITNNGVPGIIYNGVPDWVYEEEVLGSGSALWFSPDGNYLAFAVFNDTKVDNFSYIVYGDPNAFNNLYPEVVTLKYPKAGRTNPTVTLKVANLKGTAYVMMESTIQRQEGSNDFILYDVTWANNTDVSALVTNRVQNTGYVTRCSVITNECAKESTYKESRGWLSLEAPIYNSDSSAYLMILSQPEEDDTFKHIVLTTHTGVSKRLTYGKRVVQKIHGWDEQRNLIYYSSTIEGYPSQQQVFAVHPETLHDKCITCNFVTPTGVCLYSAGTFSKNYTYFAQVCQGRGPYFIVIKKLDDELYEPFVWEDNAILLSKLEGKLQPFIKDVDVVLDSGFVAKARLLLPPNFDDLQKYPAVVNVYAGPDSNRITDIYSMSFPEYFVTNHNYIYIYIDGRGSGRKGDNILFQIYRRLGTVEIEDQIAVTRCLQESFPFIDPERTGIWGWSYGGFSTIMTLIQDRFNVFRFGLAVAPVTNFVLYDSIYTERFMGLPTPEDNLIGYNNTNSIAFVEALRGKNLFLIHGNADDNVHYQQSMLLSEALELADIPFLQMSYPDENHSLGHVAAHLYHLIDLYWAKSFGLPPPPRIDLRRDYGKE